MNRMLAPWIPVLLTVALLVGCPGKLPAKTATADPAALDQRAAAVLIAGLSAPNTGIQQESASLILALPVERLTTDPVLPSSIGDALLAKVASGEASLDTQQWLIDALAESAYWKSLTPERKDEVLGWSKTQTENTRMEPREVAAYALYRLGGEEHLADLVPYLTDEERTVRAIVAEGFGRYGSGVEWPTIRRLADDDNEYVRLRAAKAMALWTVRLGPELDLEKRNAVLDSLRDDPDPFVRRMLGQVSGIDSLYLREDYRATIYLPLLRGTAPASEGEAWEAFRDTALGNFDWSLGYDLPVPQGTAELVFEFMWQDYPDLRPQILEAIARMPDPEARGFLQLAWDSGDPALRKRVLELLREIIETRGTLSEEIDPIITEITEWDWVETDPVLRDEGIRLVLLIARSQMLARFEDAKVAAWETKLADLYYSPRESVRLFIGHLNPAHPWLERAARSRFAADDRLRKTLPKLARMHWYGEDPRERDADGDIHDLSHDEWEQLWRWGILPPLAVIDAGIGAATDSVTLTQIRAAAIQLRGAVPLKPLTPDSSGSDDFADPEEPLEPPNAEIRIT